MVGPITFQGSILLMIAIVLGLIGTVLTYLNSRRLKGEIFEKPFVFFTLGFFFITFSLIAVTFFEYFLSASIVALIHDLSFIIGLGLGLIASMQITRYLRELTSFESKIKKKKKK